MFEKLWIYEKGIENCFVQFRARKEAALIASDDEVHVHIREEDVVRVEYRNSCFLFSPYKGHC